MARIVPIPNPFYYDTDISPAIRYSFALTAPICSN